MKAIKNILNFKSGFVKYILFISSLLVIGAALLDKAVIDVLLTWALGVIGYGVVTLVLLLVVISQLDDKTIRKIKKILYS